jgi:glucose-1-phosphate thymidylyltransferase
VRAIILAAGFGTRLYPLTHDKPKALLEVGGKTLLDHLVAKLEPVRVISEITLVTNGLFHRDFLQWREHVPYRIPIRIQNDCSLRPEERLGAVRDLFLGFTVKKTPEDDFLVLLGDNYFDFPLGHFLLHCLGHGRNCFIGLYDVKDREKARRYGVVQLNGPCRIVAFEEKPEDPKSTLVSLGVYYFPREYKLRLYEYLQIERLNPDRIGDFLAWLSRKETLYGVEFDGRWFDIGDIESYDEARDQLNTQIS